MLAMSDTRLITLFCPLKSLSLLVGRKCEWYTPKETNFIAASRCIQTRHELFPRPQLCAAASSSMTRQCCILHSALQAAMFPPTPLFSLLQQRYEKKREKKKKKKKKKPWVRSKAALFFPPIEETSERHDGPGRWSPLHQQQQIEWSKSWEWFARSFQERAGESEQRKSEKARLRFRFSLFLFFRPPPTSCGRRGV